MKKILIVCLTSLLLIGCSSKTTTDKTKLEKYETYYQSILDNANFLPKSDYFDISVVINKSDDNYRFDVIIDNPRVGMYNVGAMAIVDDGSVSINKETIMPTSGIIDTPYNLIPNQVNISAYYVKGIVLDGIIKEPKAKIKVMVIWQNEARSKSFKEFFSFDASYTTKK